MLRLSSRQERWGCGGSPRVVAVCGRVPPHEGWQQQQEQEQQLRQEEAWPASP